MTTTNERSHWLCRKVPHLIETYVPLSSLWCVLWSERLLHWSVSGLCRLVWVERGWITCRSVHPVFSQTSEPRACVRAGDRCLELLPLVQQMLLMACRQPSTFNTGNWETISTALNSVMDSKTHFTVKNKIRHLFQSMCSWLLSSQGLFSLMGSLTQSPEATYWSVPARHQI